MSFYAPRSPASLRDQLVTTALGPGYAAAETPDGTRVARAVPFFATGAEAVLNLVPEGEGTRVAGEVRPALMTRLLAYAAVLATADAVFGIVRGLYDSGTRGTLGIVVYVLLLAAVVSTVRDARRAQRLLRDVLAHLADPAAPAP